MALHKNSALYFKTHKNVNELWWTPDGQHFFKEEQAGSHAITLGHKHQPNKVEHATREELDAGNAGAADEKQLNDGNQEGNNTDGEKDTEGEAGSKETANAAENEAQNQADNEAATAGKKAKKKADQAAQ